MCRYGTAWWVGFTLFLMILHSFLIYLHVTWRFQEDQRPVIHCSSTFHCFCWGMLQHGYGTTLWVLLRFSWSSPDFWSIYLSFEGSDETRGLRFTVPPHFTFFPMGCYSMARHNSASFPSFFMILCLFLIYVSVVWRAQWDERPALYSSSAFHCFCQQGVTACPGITQWVLPRFSDLGLFSNLYICCLKGLMRREVCASPLFCILLFCWGSVTS
jgi:hypothetical protein